MEKSWATNGEKLLHILNLNAIYFAKWATAFKHFRSYMIWLYQALTCEKNAILIILSLGREILDHRCPCNFYITPLLSTAQDKSNTQIFLNLWHVMSHRRLHTLKSLQRLNTKKWVPNNSVCYSKILLVQVLQPEDWSSDK